MTPETTRKRAPSRRSLATRARILDAAERVFADKGFAGATMRDIAAAAGTQVGLVHHHGHGKEDLFRQTIARRAEELARRRLDALAVCKAQGTPTLPAILDCFFGPYLNLAQGDAQWLAYARLVAHVSADPAWRDISEAHFDPTAQVFIAEIAALYPAAPRARIAAGFVYSVSAMLALVTSRWRIDALAQDGAAGTLDDLVAFCAAGLGASLT